MQAPKKTCKKGLGAEHVQSFFCYSARFSGQAATDPRCDASKADSVPVFSAIASLHLFCSRYVNTKRPSQAESLSARSVFAGTTTDGPLIFRIVSIKRKLFHVYRRRCTHFNP
ncbi:unnamed protein product [Ixodes pacificus]